MQMSSENSLDPRIKNVWRIDTFIRVIIVFALIYIPLFIVNSITHNKTIEAILVATLVVFVLVCVIGVIVLPPIRFVRWKYSFTDDYLIIKRGIVWRKHFVIPFIRVQNTDTKQGPIMRMFGLESVTVATAAGNHEIPGLATPIADQFRDKAAELARLAREDV